MWSGRSAFARWKERAANARNVPSPIRARARDRDRDSENLLPMRRAAVAATAAAVRKTRALPVVAATRAARIHAALRAVAAATLTTDPVITRVTAAVETAGKAAQIKDGVRPRAIRIREAPDKSRGTHRPRL
jgi:chorismate mutase